MYLKKHCFHLFFDKGWFLFPTIRWTPKNPSKIHFGQRLFDSWASRPESRKSIRCSGCFNRDGQNGRSDVLWEAERENGGTLELKKTGVSENRGFSPQIIHSNRVFHYKPPSILGETPPIFGWKHPKSSGKSIGSTSTSLGGSRRPILVKWRGGLASKGSRKIWKTGTPN